MNWPVTVAACVLIVICVIFVCAVSAVYNRGTQHIRDIEAKKRIDAARYRVNDNFEVEKVVADPGRAVHTKVADRTVIVPGVRLIDGKYVIEETEATDRSVSHKRYSFTQLSPAVKKSKMLFPHEWNRILAPGADEIKRTVADLQSFERELESPGE